MKMYFTKHAKDRCQECGINQQSIYHAVSRLPEIQGKFQWNVSGNTIVMERCKDRVAVVTVIAGFKFRKQFRPSRKGRYVSMK